MNSSLKQDLSGFLYYIVHAECQRIGEVNYPGQQRERRAQTRGGGFNYRNKPQAGWVRHVRNTYTKVNLNY